MKSNFKLEQIARAAHCPTFEPMIECIAMKLSLWLKVTTILVLCLPLILLAPGGFCLHPDGSSCLEGPDCCDETSEPVKSSDVCQDFVPESVHREHSDTSSFSHIVLNAPTADLANSLEIMVPLHHLMVGRASEEPDRSSRNPQRAHPLLC